MCIRRTIALLTVCLAAGCGGDEAGPQTTAPTSGEMPQPPMTAAVTAEISGADTAAIEDGGQVGAEAAQEIQDPVLRLLAEMRQLQMTAGTGSEAAGEANATIVLRATEVLKQTMHDPARENDFLAAVRHLLQARYQLALTGTSDDVDRLYSDAQALNDRDAESPAAAEGIYYLAKFAHTKSRRGGQGKTEWNVSFSRWAREFASRFPQQQERALSLLFGAGRSCEMSAATASTSEDAALLRTEARLCYILLVEKWPVEPQGKEAVAVLRRLDLPGRKLSQFSGPTLSGSMVNAEQFHGRVTLVYFWDSESRVFVNEWLPLLKKAELRLTSEHVRLVGVNLDDDLDRCRRVVRELEIPGEQICFQDEARRGWNSPLVRFWGISQSPSVWVIDRNGVVDAVDVRRDALVSRINPLLQARSSAAQNR